MTPNKSIETLESVFSMIFQGWKACLSGCISEQNYLSTSLSSAIEATIERKVDEAIEYHKNTSYEQDRAAKAKDRATKAKDRATYDEDHVTYAVY